MNIRILFSLKALVSIWLLVSSSIGRTASVTDSCECPKLSCNSTCEIEQDLTFYSEKCDGGKRVKSCARPTCVPLQNAPAVCNAKNENSSGETRAPASQEKPKLVTVGKVTFLEGSLTKALGADKKLVLNKGDEVLEGDRIETDSKGKAQIQFLNGNHINLTPNSVVVITQAGDLDPKADKKKFILDLIKGRVRNKVNTAYNGEESYYRVKTPTAVAGVRGTEFVVSVDMDDKNFTSKIETVGGKVELSDPSFSKMTAIVKGESASFVAPKEAVFNEKDRAEFLAKGYLTSVYKMSDEQLARLEIETNFGSGASKSLAGKKWKGAEVAQDQPICSSPLGKLNQCSWSCENNPSGQGTCRTDLPNVTCVRRICNANGNWSKATRVPASQNESCGVEPVVRACDY